MTEGKRTVTFEINDNEYLVSGVVAYVVVDDDGERALKHISLNHPTPWDEIAMLDSVLDYKRAKMRSTWR